MKYTSSFLSTVNDWLVKIISSRYFFWFTIVLFILQAGLIALVTRFGLPPDENFHFHLIQLYAERSLDPFLGNQEGYHWMGDVTRRGSVLFHYLLSWPYRILNDLPNTFIYLRFINIGFAVGSLMLVKKLAKQLRLSDFVANLSIFMLVGTLMFTLVSAAISYDNPLIMLSLLSMVFFVSVLREFRTFTFLSLVLVMLIASVVKYTFLPLALFISLGLLVWYRRNLGEKGLRIYRDVKASVARPYWLLLLVSLVLTLVFAVERYGVNIVEYGEIRVNCTAVHSLNECREGQLFRRGERIAAMDREVTFSPHVFVLEWAETTKERIYGVFAHETARAPKLVEYGTWLIIGITAIAFIRKYNWKGRPVDYLLVISIAYIAVVAGKNYLGYSEHGIFGLALQGRYIFPILPVLYLIGNWHVEKFLKKKNTMNIVYILLALGVFLMAGLPSYLWVAGSDWYVGGVFQ